MILVDSNIFMYAVGEPHAFKGACLDLLERAAEGRVAVGVDAEVLQEILHRYRAIGRWADGRRVYDLARRAIAAVIPVTAEVVDDARELLDRHSHLTARDALHVAACRRCGAEAICSYDRDFDRVEGFKRVEPGQVK